MHAYANSQNLEYLFYLLTRKNDFKSKPNYMKLCQKKKIKGNFKTLFQFLLLIVSITIKYK